MIDRRPSLIARCHGVADVIASVDFARSHGLLVAVRGGGHNVAGYAMCDGGLMIDLSLMRAVRVDPQARRAWVQGGATWGDVDHETTAFGLATPGGLVSMTGVGGLTLSGGHRLAARQTHGLCIDNLVSVDIVTADGRLLHADDTSHRDLFWAVRGGGGNFGIVTSFEFRLHPIAPELMFCRAALSGSRRTLRSSRRGATSWRPLLNRSRSLVEFSTIPDDRRLSAGNARRACAHRGGGLRRPGRRGRGGWSSHCANWASPLLDFSGKMPYCAIQSIYDELYSRKGATAATSSRSTCRPRATR